MKKAMRKMIPAVIMLLISAMLVGTSTYAWFSMNRTVTVQGMSVTTVVKDSLLISETLNEQNFDVSLNQTRTGRLRPVSTVNGYNFFYTAGDNVKGNGDARTETYVAYDEDTATSGLSETETAGKTYYDDAFQTAYAIGSVTNDTVAYGYIDYDFYIKAVNVSGSSEDLMLSQINLRYNGTAVTEKAWRVAVFAKDTVDATTTVSNDVLFNTAGADPTQNLKTILAPAGADYYTDNKAVNSTSTTDTVSNLSSAATIGSISSGATKYYRVVIRLWLEGEDETCTNETFATLTNAYSLKLMFALGNAEGETAVTAIGVRDAVATVSGSGTTTATATLDKIGVKPADASTYQWKLASNNENIAGATNSTYSPASSGSEKVYCVISGNDSNTYQTNNVTVTKE